MSKKYKGQPGWQRVLFVVLFWLIFYVAQMVVAAVAFLQCVFVLITDKPNQHLLKFGASLSKYVHDIVAFITFNSDQRPFPFMDFPKPDVVIPSKKA